MPYYKFKKNDLFYNVIKTHPVSEFSIYDGKVYYNNTPQISGAFTASVPGVPPGNISLYELNVDRNKDDHLFVPKTIENDNNNDPENPNNTTAENPTNTDGVKSLIFPYVEKNSDQNLKFKHITETEYNAHYEWGQMITGSYPLSASIKRNFYDSQEDANVFDQPEATKPANAAEAWNQAFPPDPIELVTKGDAGALYTARPRIQALRNTLNYYSPMSRHYVFSSSIDGWRKDTQELNLISITSIYYGHCIKRGSVDLKFYVKGKLVGRTRDIKKNGELIDITTVPFSRRSVFFDGFAKTSAVSNVFISSNEPNFADFIKVPSVDNSLSGLSSLTVSMWVNALKLPGANLAWYTLIHTSDNWKLWIDPIPNGAGGARIYFETLKTDNVNVNGRWKVAGELSLGSWHHIAVSYDGALAANNPVVYVDGVSKSITETVTPSAGISDNVGPTLIGHRFRGHIDEVSIWNDNLDEDEVGEIYNSGKACNLVTHSKYSNLVSWWRMGEVTDTEAAQLEENPTTGPTSNLIGDPPLSTNFIIPDEKGSNTAYMIGFADWNQKAPPPDYEFMISGITGVAAPSCLTSSLVGLDEGEDHPIAGVVLYNEGFIILTGSWNLDENTQSDYKNDGSANDYPRWTYFGARLTSGSGDAGNPSLSIGDPTVVGDRSHDLSMEAKDNLRTGDHSLDDAFFHISLSGTNYVPTRTMLAHAPKGRLNHSNNPTYVTFNSANFESTGALGYFEGHKTPIKNIVSSSHKNYSASFDKHTFVSKIGIYDENRNLIGISKLATPVRKREIDNLTFKIKLDF